MTKIDICQRGISSVNWLSGITLQFIPCLLWYIRTNSKQKKSNKAIASQLLKKFLAFYVTQSFTTALTRSRYLFLSGDRSVQFTLSHPISVKAAFILFFHISPCLTNVLFFLGFPNKFLYAFLFPRVRPTWHAHFILLDLVTSSSKILLRLLLSPDISLSLCSAFKMKDFHTHEKQNGRL